MSDSTKDANSDMKGLDGQDADINGLMQEKDREIATLKSENAAQKRKISELEEANAMAFSEKAKKAAILQQTHAIFEECLKEARNNRKKMDSILATFFAKIDDAEAENTQDT